MAKAADLIFDLEFSRRPTVKKYKAASKALGRAFTKRDTYYADFYLMMGLRNEIMHLKPPRPNADHEGLRITNLLAARGIAIPFTQYGLPWIDRLYTPDVAKWACTVAQTVIVQTLALTPQGPGSVFGMVYDQFAKNSHIGKFDWT
jgi:hypothetical protein